MGPPLSYIVIAVSIKINDVQGHSKTIWVPDDPSETHLQSAQVSNINLYRWPCWLMGGNEVNAHYLAGAVYGIELSGSRRRASYKWKLMAYYFVTFSPQELLPPNCRDGLNFRVFLFWERLLCVSLELSPGEQGPGGSPAVPTFCPGCAQHQHIPPPVSADGVKHRLGLH